MDHVARFGIHLPYCPGTRVEGTTPTRFDTSQIPCAYTSKNAMLLTFRVCVGPTRPLTVEL